MPVELEEIRTDHRGDRLPPGVYALVAPDGAIVGYKARWREEDDDGVGRNRAKRFSARKLGSLDPCARGALAYREAAVEIVQPGEVVARSDRNGNMTVGDLFKEGSPTTPRRTGSTTCGTRPSGWRCTQRW